VEDVKSLSLQVLYRLVKFSDKRLLSENLPQIAGCLLESLSSLESGAMNYIEQHADRVGIDKESLDSLRVRAANASIVGDMLDRVAHSVNEENLADVSGKLAGLIKGGFGTNTRAGAARFLSSIVLRMRYDIKPVCSKLLKALTYSLGDESNRAVCKAYASTFAQLSKFSDERKVDSRVEKLLEVIHGEGSTMHSIFILELARQAPDVFARHKPRILPLAFYMKHNSSKKVKAVWEAVWDEEGPAASTAVRIFHEEIGTLCLEALQSDKWDTRRAGALGIKELVEKSDGIVLNNRELLCNNLLDALKGRYWDGKEVILEALGKLLIFQQLEGDLQLKALRAFFECLKKKKTVLVKAADKAILEAVPFVKEGPEGEVGKLLDEITSFAGSDRGKEEDESSGEETNGKKDGWDVEKFLPALSKVTKEWRAKHS